jgi:hypothetical protein
MKQEINFFKDSIIQKENDQLMASKSMHANDIIFESYI